jgi:hypothetical protein
MSNSLNAENLNIALEVVNNRVRKIVHNLESNKKTAGTFRLSAIIPKINYGGLDLFLRLLSWDPLCCPGLTINGGRRGLSSKIEIVTAEWRPIPVNEHTLNHWNFISNNHGRKRIASDAFTSGKHTNMHTDIFLSICIYLILI